MYPKYKSPVWNLETGPQIKTKFSKNDIFLKEKAVKSTAAQKIDLELAKICFGHY